VVGKASAIDTRTGPATALNTAKRQRREGSRPSGKISSINVSANKGTMTGTRFSHECQVAKKTKSMRSVTQKRKSDKTAKNPTLRHSQPTPFSGRSEATTAPTVAYARKSAGPNTAKTRALPITAGLAEKGWVTRYQSSLITCELKKVVTTKIKTRSQIDQAITAAVRVLVLVIPSLKDSVSLRRYVTMTTTLRDGRYPKVTAIVTSVAFSKFDAFL
jgi:hypothetical protein